MTLSLIQEGSEILSKVSEPFDFANPIADPYELAEGMHQLMFDESGCGLAANQIGLATRLFVMDINGERRTCFNPEVLFESKETILIEEGCLSFPSLYIKVKRPLEIKVRYQDVDSKWCEEDYDGLFARCTLHELDHLNGICFVDKVSKMVLNMAQGRRAKQGRK